jgi:hypothetical protein
MRFLFLLFFISFLSLNNMVFGQNQSRVLWDTAFIGQEQYRMLKEEFGINKKLPPGYEKVALHALSFFPELKKNRIHFKVRNNGAPASSRPAWGSLFRNAGKRTYMVFINSGKDSSRFGSIFLNASDSAQVGVIGHELSHVVNFSKETSLGLMGMGVAHISKPYMDRFEFYTDSLAIAHGLGYYQMEWAAIFDKMFSGSGMQDPFKNKNTPTGERYMSVATIQDYMRKMGY